MLKHTDELIISLAIFCVQTKMFIFIAYSIFDNL